MDQREGGNAVVIQHSAVFGRLETPVRQWRVGDVEPYAQYDQAVHITFIQPRKRKRNYIVMKVDRKGKAERFTTIEADGETVYDSRADVPIDMDQWKETATKFGMQEAL